MMAGLACSIVLATLGQTTGDAQRGRGLNYEDPKVRQTWAGEQRTIVRDYLVSQHLPATGVPEAPAWSLPPYLAVWRSTPSAGKSVWVISGDLPTDYLPLSAAAGPRDAVRAFALRWERAAGNMLAGKPDPEIYIGKPQDRKRIGDLLQKRAAALKDFAARDGLWEESVEPIGPRP